MTYKFMRFPEGRSKAVTFSYDDGYEADLRLAQMFTKKGLKATFNLNGEKRKQGKFGLCDEDVKRYIYGGGHEVAIHGLEHKAPCFVRPLEAIKDILDCRVELEGKFDRIIRGLAYPDSGINRFQNGSDYDTVKGYLTDLGIAYARAAGGDNSSFEIPADFHRWMPTAHHDNPKIMSWIDEFLAVDMLDKAQYFGGRRYPRLFYIWGHSYEFDRKNNWEHMEEITDRLSGKEDIWYATNIEICDYTNAFYSLVTNAEGNIIYNPTMIKVWFDVDGTTYSVAPGETLKIEN